MNTLCFLQDELQCTEDARLRLDVNMQALKAEHARALAAKDGEGDDKRKGLVKQVQSNLSIVKFFFSIVKMEQFPVYQS